MPPLSCRWYNYYNYVILEAILDSLIIYDCSWNESLDATQSTSTRLPALPRLPHALWRPGWPFDQRGRVMEYCQPSQAWGTRNRRYTACIIGDEDRTSVIASMCLWNSWRYELFSIGRFLTTVQCNFGRFGVALWKIRVSTDTREGLTFSRSNGRLFRQTSVSVAFSSTSW